MREVEAELVGPHSRSRLLDVLAEHLAQRLCAAGASRCGSPSSGSARSRGRPLHTFARGEARLRGRAAPGRRRSGRPRRSSARTAGVVVELDAALVGDLAAASRIERRLAQLGEERAVPELLESAGAASAPRSWVADELGRKSAARANSAARCGSVSPPAREISRCSAIARGRRRRRRAGPRSSASSTVSSSGKPYVAASVNASSPEIASWPASSSKSFMPALERLREALLLGPDGALDLVGVLDQLRVRARPSARRRRRAAGRRRAARCGAPGAPRAG